MIKNQSEPHIRETLIKPDSRRSLQAQVSEAIENGFQRIILEGLFPANGQRPFSLLTLSQDVEIVGRHGATLDGENQVSHLVFIADGARVKIKGITFINGNTAEILSQLNLDNHPHTRLNVFRYLDGGAMTIGAGSEVVLEDCVFRSNHSAVCGGAISNAGGYLHLTKCSFSSNTCGDTGAAIDSLAKGSLTFIDSCQFSENEANKLGNGRYGSVTAFPDTFVIVSNSDFSSENNSTAVDYRPNKNGEVFVALNDECIFNSENPDAVLKNPASNTGTKKLILIRYARLLARHPGLVKLESIPSADRATREKHRAMYEKLVEEHECRVVE